MKIFLKYMKPYLLLLVLAVVFIYIQVWADLKLPDYMSRIVNEGIVNEDQGFILSTGKDMLLVSLIGGIFTIFASFVTAKFATGFSKDLREGVFKHIESFSLTEFSEFSTSSLITRSTNDVQQVQTVLSTFLRLIIWAPILGVGAVLQAYSTAPSISWIIALAVIIIISLMIIVFTFAVPKFKLIQILTDKLNLVSRENLAGLRVIRAFNTQEKEQHKFDSVNKELTKANLFVNRVMVILQPMMMMIFNFTSVAIIWFGAHLIGSDNLQIGEMMAFMQYSMQVLMAFLMLSIVFIMVPRAIVSLERIKAVLNTEPTVKDPINPILFPKSITGKIEFKDVSFSYKQADEPVVKNINFIAEPGQVTALIGSTGSGKSTIVNLIPRFFDVTKGEILIDGTDIRKVKQEDLHKIIGYTSQKAILFSGDIKSNIKYTDLGATDEDMKEAARIAQASEFIEELEDKYDASMAQAGANFSGGQKQRISIARTLLNKPEIFIFDDTFSALDFKTDSVLRAELKKSIKDKTVIIVAQRVGTIIDADKIIVLESGEIVGQGTHEELMQTCTIYKEIAESQLSKEDLAR